MTWLLAAVALLVLGLPCLILVLMAVLALAAKRSDSPELVIAKLLDKGDMAKATAQVFFYSIPREAPRTQIESEMCEFRTSLAIRLLGMLPEDSPYNFQVQSVLAAYAEYEAALRTTGWAHEDKREVTQLYEELKIVMFVCAKPVYRDAGWLRKGR